MVPNSLTSTIGSENDKITSGNFTHSRTYSKLRCVSKYSEQNYPDLGTEL